ncbi:MAG: proteasome accessory factor PafA2 family protein [bacterium]|nr:proteasome accessory factor PafA2 family protein [bacterium]
MLIPDRAYGMEIEYGCILKSLGRVLPLSEWPADFLSSYLFRRADRQAGVMPAHARFWRANGSLTYIDTGHPEHAAPESRSIRDAMIYSQAGDRIIADIFGETTDYGKLEIMLFRNNIAPENDTTLVTYGCHENYLAYGLTPYAPTAVQGARDTFLSPFLITRQILDGTGYWNDDGTFFLSQRARIFGRNAHESLGHPLAVGVKYEGYAPRIHLIYGDSNMLDVATFLKLGTTSLMLALIEDAASPPIAIHFPLRELDHIARSGPMERVVCLMNGDMMSAHQIQTMYWEAARRLVSQSRFESPETKAEMELVLNLWEQALNAIEHNDIDWMLGRIDWATKRWLVDRELIKRNGVDSSVRAGIRGDICLMYHLINNPASLQKRMQKFWRDRRMATDTEIVHAMNNPPQGTRAQYRGAVIRAAIDGRMHHGLAVDWHHASVQGSKGFHRFEMHRPLDDYGSVLPAVKNAMLNCWQ